MEQTLPSPAPQPETRKSIFEFLMETLDEVPEAERAKIPTDGAENHDHYLYGAPKRTVSAGDAAS